MYDPITHYDRVTLAWTWLLGDELHYGVFERDDEPLAAATARLTGLMADAAGLAAGLDVLDVGCGTGRPAEELARVHGCRVTAITTSAVGARETARRADDPEIRSNVRVVCADGTRSPFAGERFDRVWVLESSHLMPARDRLLVESARVLRPGGRLVLCDVVLRRPIDLAGVMQRRDDFLLLREVFGEARMEPLAVYARHAAAAGLSVVEQRDLTAATRPTFARWRENARRHRTEVEPLLGARGLDRFVLAADVLERFWDEGVLGYAFLAARKPSG